MKDTFKLNQINGRERSIFRRFQKDDINEGINDDINEVFEKLQKFQNGCNTV